MRFGQTVRFHVTALLMGFIGGAAGWFLLDSTVSAQSSGEVIEASRIIVDDRIVIDDGQITIRNPRRNDSFAAVNIQGLTVRNGRGRGAQLATVQPGIVSLITKYDERPEIFKRIELEAGHIKYFPDFRSNANSQESETLDMDGLFKRTRAEINALRNRRGRI